MKQRRGWTTPKWLRPALTILLVASGTVAVEATVLSTPAQAASYVNYYLPYTYDVRANLNQGNNVPAEQNGSHYGNNAWAYDFGLGGGAVRASAPGEIVRKVTSFTGPDTNSTGTAMDGNTIVIKHADDTCTRYAHLAHGSVTSKSVGDTVGQAEVLGNEGDTGNVSGAHLHFQRDNCNWVSISVDFVEDDWRSKNSTTASSVTSISSQITPDGVQHTYSATGNYVYDISWGNGAPLTGWQIWNAGGPVAHLSSQVDLSGVQHVYAASGSIVYDISWGNGAPLTRWQVGSFSSNVTSLSSQMVGNVHHVYASFSNGTVHDVTWGGGTSLSQWQVANLGTSVTSLSSKVAGGVQHVYAASGNYVYDISWGNGASLTVWQIWNAGGTVSRVSSQLTPDGVQHVYASIGSDVYDISWGNGNPLVRWKVGTAAASVTGLSSQLAGSVQHVYAVTSTGTVHDITWGGGTSLSQWQPTNVGSASNAVSSQITSNGVQHVYAGTADVYDISWGNGNPLVQWKVGDF